MSGLLIFVLLIIAFILICFFSQWFYEVACFKGYPERKYFWICFWFGPIGYLLVAALPDHGNPQSHDDLPNL